MGAECGVIAYVPRQRGPHTGYTLILQFLDDVGCFCM